MITVHKAKSIIDQYLTQLNSEVILINESSKRIIYHDLEASFPSPRFDNSAMDGFAVRSVDTIGASKEDPVSLKVIGISSAGIPSNLTLNPGECIQCMTGATIPNGADAVLMVEHTSGFSDNDSVLIFLETHPEKHIRKKGEEVQKGDPLISKGTRITPSEIGTLASFGFRKFSVVKKPQIAIFGTGDELIEPGETIDKGQVYNSNLYIFADLVKKIGGDVTMKKVVKDNKDSLNSFLSKALKTSDVIISSGGISMGRFDYVRDVFIELGIKEHFWKVAQKPGKPLFFGTENDTLIFGLPGNPISAYIGFMEWVWPVLESIMGIPRSKPITGFLTESFPREKCKYRYLFGQTWFENEKLFCKPSGKTGSHMLSSSLSANCILGSDQGENPLQPGDKININVLPWKHIR